MTTFEPRTDWVDIPDYPGYVISPKGEVASRKTGDFLKLHRNQMGIMMVRLTHASGRGTTKSVASLVANTFLEPHESPLFDTPIHLDGDKSNVDVTNLDWRPRWFAIRYHRQFYITYVNRIYDHEVIHLESETAYPGSLEAARAFGLLERDVVFRGCVCHESVWPGPHHFEKGERL